jgi:hypothetical protein
MSKLIPVDSELATLQTPWDSDKVLMVDVGCAERGCACTASEWAAGNRPECVPFVEYKPWVGLTDEELIGAYETEQQGRWGDHVRSLRAIEAKLKEKNSG